MKKSPILVTAASVTALMGAQAANAALDFSSTVIVDGPALTLTGGGASSGTGSFGAATLTINSVGTTNTNLAGTATLTTTSIYNGTITGSTFTADGTGSSQILCTGSSQTCGNVAGGAFTGGDMFTVDTATGGSWVATGTQYNGLITTTSTSVLTPQGGEVPLPAAAWLFGSALLGLAGVSRKRKAA